jgi:hypothetical protein
MRIILIAFLAVSAAFLSGCVAVVGGAGGAAYVSGDVEQDLEADINKVAKAVTASFDELDLKTINTNHDGVSGVFEARTAKDEKIKVLLTRTGDNITHVSIRVGLFGNEALSQLVLDQIKKQL